MAIKKNHRLHKMDMSLKLLERGAHKAEQTDWRHDASKGDIFIGTKLSFSKPSSLFRNKS